MPPAVPRPARLALLRAERALLAVTDRVDPVGRNAEVREVAADAQSAPLAEREVVLVRPALVAVSLDLDRERRVLPLVDEATAQAIIARRPYKAAEDLAAVPEVGPCKYRIFKHLIEVKQPEDAGGTARDGAEKTAP